MALDKVRVRWSANRQFSAWDSAGHGIVLDATPEYGGESTGPRPIELVLYALAGCTAMDVVSVLEKKREPFTGLEMEVEATQREDEFPKIYTRIELVYVVKGSDVKPKSVERAIELSHDKYCSVRGMFGPQVEIMTSYRIEA
ncbi:MAG: OsmC family protein [Coriobacteriia bacterium]|nr:OsmC family protein [Coriobacteriia bacterium]